MCFMAYELAVNTDIQDRLRKEIEETNEQCAGTLTYEALMKMKYMDMVASGKILFTKLYIIHTTCAFMIQYSSIVFL